MRGAPKKNRPSQTEIDSAVDFAQEWFGTPRELIFSPTRVNEEASITRHLAQYLLQTSHGYCDTAIAEVFRRDKNSIRHAVRHIEDLRDDAQFNKYLDEYKGASNSEINTDPHDVCRPFHSSEHR